MTHIDPDQLLDILREAAALINQVYACPFDVKYKGPDDPVTLADQRANDLIVQRLHDAYPSIPIVAEESDPCRYAGFREARTVFFVDPLDGTREFVKRNGEFVTMVGVLDGDRPSIGVILQPTTNQACLGVVGSGAWRVDGDGTRHPTRVSKTSEMANAHIVASRSGSRERYEQVQRELGIGSISPLGSAGMKGLAIARGEADAYVTPHYGGHRWDACALEALVAAAGGRFSDAHGVPIDYRSASLVNDRGLVCSNAELHDDLLASLADLRERRWKTST